MLKSFLLLALLLGSSSGHSQDWSCSSGEPTECSGNVQSTFSSGENSCLLKLYTCGRYQDIVARMDTLKIGLAPEHNYYLGAAYFGLSNRTDAQSMKCHYFRRAKAQIDEFLVAIETNPASNVSYGSEQRMDIIYHATRLAELMKKEKGCVESSFSEGSIYRMARLLTQEQMKSLLHRSEDSSAPVTGAQKAASDGFQAIRDSMGSFVTKTSQLESRYSLYEAQVRASTEQFKNLGSTLQTGLGQNVVIIGAGEFGLPTVQLNLADLNQRMASMSSKLRDQALTPLSSYEAIANLYFKNRNPADPGKDGKYYDELRQDKIAEVRGLLALFATYTNLLSVKSPEAEAVHAALEVSEPGFETPVLLGAPINDLFKVAIAKNCKPLSRKNYWYCK